MRKILLLLVLLLLSSLSAGARPVQDEAGLFQPETVSRLEKIDAEIYRDTGKHLLVVTANNVAGTPREKARDIFRQERLNGLLILILPDKKQLGIVPGRSTERLFPAQRLAEIRESMLGHIRQGNFDSAALQGAEAMRATLLAAERGPSEGRGAATAPPAAPSEGRGSGLLGWLPLLFFGFLAFLAIRFMSRRKSYYAPGQHQQQPYGAGYNQPAYGGPVGGPAGGGGWGGGLFGSLAAGLGGALLGNTIYDAVTGRHATPPAAAAEDSPSWTDSDAGSMGGGDFGGWGSDGGDMGGGDFGGGGSDW